VQTQLTIIVIIGLRGAKFANLKSPPRLGFWVNGGECMVEGSNICLFGG
jgi:hypothetical protein